MIHAPVVALCRCRTDDVEYLRRWDTGQATQHHDEAVEAITVVELAVQYINRIRPLLRGAIRLQIVLIFQRLQNPTDDIGHRVIR